MKTEMEKYSLLANLFEYPDAGLPERARDAKAWLDDFCPAAGHEMERFIEFVDRSTKEEQEEVYTRTFEVQGITTLDVTYVMFGDDYKRGACLVNLNREHNATGNDTHGELADHLPAILRLLPKMEDRLLADELIERLLMPSLRMVIEAFGPEKRAMKNRVYKKHHTLLIETSVEYSLVYSHPLRALLHFLEQDHKAIEEVVPERTADFLRNIQTELVNGEK